MVRRSKNKVLKDLPEKIRNIVYLKEDTPKGFMKVKFNERYLTEQELAFEEISGVRYEIGLHKAPLAVKYIEELLTCGHEKIIVFGHHKDVIDILKKGLSKYNPVVITGETNPQEKVKAVDLFMNSKQVRVFIGNIKAAGVGLTLTSSSYVVVVEPDWTPGGNSQAEDRAHRIGQKNQVICDYLVLPDSIDEHILIRVLEKEKVIRTAMRDD